MIIDEHQSLLTLSKQFNTNMSMNMLVEMVKSLRLYNWGKPEYGVQKNWMCVMNLFFFEGEECEIHDEYDLKDLDHNHDDEDDENYGTQKTHRPSILEKKEKSEKSLRKLEIIKESDTESEESHSHNNQECNELLSDYEVKNHSHQGVF